MKKENPDLPSTDHLRLSLLGELLVARRKELGITQQELAERLGILQEAVARMERDKYRGVSLERLVRIEQALDMTITIDAPSPNGVLKKE